MQKWRHVFVNHSCCLSVQFKTEGHEAAFSIKIRHGVTPKLYNTGSIGGTQPLVCTVHFRDGFIVVLMHLSGCAPQNTMSAPS